SHDHVPFRSVERLAGEVLEKDRVLLPDGARGNEKAEQEDGDGCAHHDEVIATIHGWPSTNARFSTRNPKPVPVGSPARSAGAPTTTASDGCGGPRRIACHPAPAMAIARSSPSSATTCCGSTTRSSAGRARRSSRFRRSNR